MSSYRSACLAAAALLAVLIPHHGVQAGGAPRLACDNPVYEFGSADETVIVENVFILRNTGSAPLEIRGVETSCGCTITQMSGSVIPPGGAAPLTAKLNLKGRRGRQEKNITVSSNDPQQPQLVLKMIGQATAEVDVSPPQAAFMDLRDNQVAEREVTIVNNAADPLEITGLEIRGDNFTVRQVALSEGRSILLKIKTVPPLPSGISHGSVILTTNNPKYKSITVPVSIAVASDIIVAPGVIALAYDPKDTPPVTVMAVVKSRSLKPFKITRVEAPSDDMRVRIEPFGMGTYKLELANIVPSDLLNGKWLLIYTDNPSGREVRVPIRTFPRIQASSPGIRPAGN